MSNTLLTVLTDASARGSDTVEQSLIDEAHVAGPWLDEA